VVSVTFGRLRSELLHAISYLISRSPSVFLTICDLSATLLRNLTVTSRGRSSSVSDPAYNALVRLECSATTPPSLCSRNRAAEHLGDGVVAVRQCQHAYPRLMLFRSYRSFTATIGSVNVYMSAQLVFKFNFEGLHSFV
jgi:hypothetical protein